MAETSIEIPCWRDRIASRLAPLGAYSLLDITQRRPWGEHGIPTDIQIIVAFTRGRPFFTFIIAPIDEPAWYAATLYREWWSAATDHNYAIPPRMILAGGGVIDGRVSFWTYEVRAFGGPRLAALWGCRGQDSFDWWADEFLILRFFFDLSDNVNAVVWGPTFGGAFSGWDFPAQANYFSVILNHNAREAGATAPLRPRTITGIANVQQSAAATLPPATLQVNGVFPAVAAPAPPQTDDEADEDDREDRAHRSGTVTPQPTAPNESASDSPEGSATESFYSLASSEYFSADSR
ncbi:uncharacterized protein BO97DRAFT_459854 [Aspergillus homomorphus CBS 101889]|uniref:Uncharacterized protein n=1 Tax=Aspergillus homomorphus (strain CBS 101889) TaxID=1450537 RepID=A0A395HMN9_ASPHC|nr:hypothetical protein BO97DRAFT_459854 [Aspergillus homomorphus CBS 101889]RAL08886.1 hypothetical protein BO97DRAFT_459854 [Aspergillus homomorphus CBS 101889]